MCDKIYNIVDASSELCRETCTYKFKYADRTFTIKNKNKYLELEDDTPISQHYNGKNDQIKLNGINSIVTGIKLFYGSLFKVNDAHSVATLVIEHLSDDGIVTLVCIPFISSNSKSSNEIDTLISSTSTGTLPITSPSISLDNIVNTITSKPFYYYQGPYPYGKCDNHVNIIITQQSYISETSLTTLNNLGLKKYSDVKKNGKKKKIATPNILLKNKDGAQSIDNNKNETFIYTGCEIGGQIQKTTPEDYEKEKQNQPDNLPLQWVGISLIIIILLVFIVIIIHNLINSRARARVVGVMQGGGGSILSGIL